MSKVLINVPNWRNLIKPDALKLLEQTGFEIIANETGKMAERSFILKNISKVDALIAGGEQIDEDLISQGKKLKVIARYGVGVDNIDVEFATKNNIFVTVTAGANSNSVAEHTVSLILAVQRQLRYYSNAILTGNWQINEYPELTGKTIGLVGFGRIARLVTKRLSGFEVRVLAYDPYLNKSDISEYGVQYAPLKTLLAQSDIVSLHTPLVSDTYHLIGERELMLMKSTAYIVNTARGALIDEDALVNALSKGQLAGAGLDVVEKEPCSPNHPLFSMPNVIVTPHIAGGSVENHVKAGLMCVNAILDIMKGKKPVNAINF